MLALGGCVYEESENEETSEDTGEALVRYPDLQFASAHSARVTPPGTFQVAEGGAVAVAMEPKWKPAGPTYHCKAPAIQVILTRTAPKREVIGLKSVATFGGPSSLQWPRLHAGTYALDVDTANDNPACVLTSKIEIVITP